MFVFHRDHYDVNDNYPVFIPSTYSFFASYYAATATTIGIVTVSDADSGTYGTVTLTLNQTSLGSEYFGITCKGEIYTQKSVSPIGAGTTCVVQILATDGGGLVTTANVTIAISVSTTVLTTVTVTSSRTFIQDGRNVAWISLSGIIAVVIVIVFFWILCKINREGAPKFNCRRCHGKQKSPKAQKQKTEIKKTKIQETEIKKTEIQKTEPQKKPQGENRLHSLYERATKEATPAPFEFWK